MLSKKALLYSIATVLSLLLILVISSKTNQKAEADSAPGPPPSSCPDVIINEFAPFEYPPSTDSEWVELLNQTDQPINLDDGWILRDYNNGDPNNWNDIPLSGTIDPLGDPSGGIFVFNYNSYNLQSHLRDGGDGIVLLCPITDPPFLYPVPAPAVRYGSMGFFPNSVHVDNLTKGGNEYAAYINGSWLAQTCNSKGFANDTCPTTTPTPTPTSSPTATPTVAPTATPTQAPTSTPSPTPTPTTSSSTDTTTVTSSSTTSTSPPTCNDSAPGGAPKITSALAGTNSVILKWDKALEPVTYYLIAYGTKSGSYIYGNPNVGDRDTTSYTIRNLSGNTTYYFVVRAGNGCKPGSFSNEVSATPTGPIVRGSASGFSPNVLGVATEVIATGEAEVLSSTMELASSDYVVDDDVIEIPKTYPNPTEDKRHSSIRKKFLVILAGLIVLGVLNYYLLKKKKVNQ